MPMLNPKIFDADVEQKPTRDGYGTGVLIAGEADERVVVLCADLTESTRSEAFSKKFPERFIEVGVAEQNLATLAAGMANYGKIPFISSYAMFSPGRNWEQIRTTICYNDVPVKIIGAHAGVSVGPDGATHQALEDIAMMRVMPNISVIVPCDAIEAEKATVAAAKTEKPVYIRLAREKSPIITTNDTPFGIGKANVLYDNNKKPDVAIIGAGPVLYNALLVAQELEKSGINVRVINLHTIKPIGQGGDRGRTSSGWRCWLGRGGSAGQTLSGTDGIRGCARPIRTIRQTRGTYCSLRNGHEGDTTGSQKFLIINFQLSMNFQCSNF
jgi:transketolase